MPSQPIKTLKNTHEALLKHKKIDFKSRLQTKKKVPTSKSNRRSWKVKFFWKIENFQPSNETRFSRNFLRLLFSCVLPRLSQFQLRKFEARFSLFSAPAAAKRWISSFRERKIGCRLSVTRKSRNYFAIPTFFNLVFSIGSRKISTKQPAFSSKTK